MSFLDSILSAGKTAVGFLSGDSIGSSLARTALSAYALNRVMRSQQKANNVNNSRTITKTTRLSLAPNTEHKIPVVYGQATLSGAVTDARLVNGATMWFCVTICERTGKLDLGQGADSTFQFQDAYWNDNRLIFREDGVTVSGYYDRNGVLNTEIDGLISVYFYGGGSGIPVSHTNYPGTHTQPAYSLMPEWTTQYAMSELVFALVRVDFSTEFNVKGIENMKFTVKNSMNKPGDCLYDMMTNTRYGAGIDPAEINTGNAEDPEPMSLSSLNAFSELSIDVNDQRPAGVIFDRRPPLSAKDQILDITSTSVAINPGIDIVEIINYQTADVRYRVKIVPGTIASWPETTLVWPTLPAGVTLNYNAATYTYTLSGIDTPAQWQAVRSFTWNLPSDYALDARFFLEADIIYYDGALEQEVEKSWVAFDPDFYWVGQFEANFGLDIAESRIRPGQVTMNSAAGWICDEGLAKQGRAQLNTNFGLQASAVDVFIDGVFTQTTVARRDRSLVAPLSSTFTQSTSETVTLAVTNMIDRVYFSNRDNLIFQNNTPSITDPLDTVYTVSLTSANGEFGTSSDLSTAFTTLTFTGTKASVNAWFPTVIFYPNKNFTGTGSFTYTQERSGLSFSKTQSLGYAGDGTLPATVYTFNTSGSITLGDQQNYIWIPKFTEKKYFFMDYLVIGGGGKGSPGTATKGGNAGQLHYITNDIIDENSYSVLVGNGTLGSGTGVSSFNGYVAQPDYQGVYTSGNNVTVSGAGTAFGGGAGSAQSGFDGTITGSAVPYTITGGNGGNGTFINITGTGRYYAAGGGGGFSSSSSSNIDNKGADGLGGGVTPGYGNGGTGGSTTAPNTVSNPENGISGVVIIRVHP